MSVRIQTSSFKRKSSSSVTSLAAYITCTTCPETILGNIAEVDKLDTSSDADSPKSPSDPIEAAEVSTNCW